jgi:cell division protein FtsB
MTFEAHAGIGGAEDILFGRDLVEMKRKKKVSFFLKVLVVVLAVYSAVTLVHLQIELNAQRDRRDALAEEKDRQLQKNAALASFSESELDDEAVTRIAREELGLVMPDEVLIVDVGR